MPYDTETIVEPKCPICHGKMWDNRETKKNPKAPDFKCRDKQCEGVIWPPKNLPAAGPRMPQPSAKPVATQGKEPYSSGPALPYETESETGAPPTDIVGKLDQIFAAYSACFAFAYRLAHDKMGADATHEGIAAMAATTFIAAKGR